MEKMCTEYVKYVKVNVLLLLIKIIMLICFQDKKTTNKQSQKLEVYYE